MSETGEPETIAYETFIDLLQFDPYKLDIDRLQLLSTIRYDPGLTSNRPTTVADVKKANFFCFSDHIDRLRFTADFFTSSLKNEKLVEDLFPYEITEKYIFDQLRNTLFESQVRLDLPMKVRLLMNMNGEVTIELHETPVRKNLLDGLDEGSLFTERFDLYVQNEPILPSPFTSFKTTHRTVYTNARNKALPGQRPGKEEVLLVNTSNQVMEGSITNIAVRNEKGQWITPQLTSGCLCGVARKMLVRENHIYEGSISRSLLVKGQDVLLFNGIMGVVRGTIIDFV